MKLYKNQNQLLEAKIAALQIQQAKNLKDLRTHIDLTYQELMPSNLLNRALNDLKEAPEFKSNLFQSLISISGGYLSKKLLIGKSNNIFKKLLGFATQYLATKYISKYI